MKKSLRPLAAAAMAIGVAAVSAASASASAPTGIYAPFKYCPYQNSALTGCLVSNTTSGSFRLGTATVPVTTPIVLQGGIAVDDNNNTTWYNAGNGGATLSNSPQNVPGGLLGLMNPGGFFGLLEQAFENAVRSANGVTATAELAGPVQFNYLNYLISDGTAVTLPLKIHLQNAFLGPNCYIGTTSSPVTLKLTTGTTAPPAGTAPITGDPGTLTQDDDGHYALASGVKLVDNAFSVPAATDCGYLPLDKLLITAAVNSREGLPARAGTNSATLQGSSQIADIAQVRNSVR